MMIESLTLASYGLEKTIVRKNGIPSLMLCFRFAFG